MKIYRDISVATQINKAVVTTGTFDGVHTGHQQILKRVVQEAKKIGGESVVLTFWPHPRMVIFPDDHQLKLLNTLNEKASLLESFGIDHFIIYHFSKRFSRLSSEEYVKELLVDGIGVHKMAVGYDHRFGKNREGDFNALIEFAEKYSFEVEEIPAKDVDDVNVSSTKIRKALDEGDVETAAAYLSYPYFMHGKVVHGKGLGKSIGYPTANIQVEDSFKLIPKQGVYAVWVEIGVKRCAAMMNIGTRPTIADDNRASLEVHIFDFNEDLYNQELKISFVKRLRDEQKFENVQALSQQLNRDKEHCRALLLGA